MLRYKTETRPGLVALYNIRPGNRAGQFLQPWSPHGAITTLNAPVPFTVLLELHLLNHSCCNTYLQPTVYNLSYHTIPYHSIDLWTARTETAKKSTSVAVLHQNKYEHLFQYIPSAHGLESVMESLGLSQKDAQSRNKWRRRIKGATG